MNNVRKNQLIRLLYMLILDAGKRSNYLKKTHYFGKMGDNVLFYPRKLPADPQFIRFHNNIVVASEVMFINHDVIHSVFNKMLPTQSDKLSEYYNCIEIMDNVFIGSRSILLPEIKIGPNAIIGAGSVVTRDVPENAIVAGNPAVIIGDFDKLLQARIKRQSDFPEPFDIETYWKFFQENQSHKISY